MSDEQWVGLFFVAGGVLTWFLTPRVAREHHPDDPRAHTRRGPSVARVWTPGKRTAYLLRGRVLAVVFVGFGLALIGGLL